MRGSTRRVTAVGMGLVPQLVVQCEDNVSRFRPGDGTRQYGLLARDAVAAW
jgi:hypothetical protein